VAAVIFVAYHLAGHTGHAAGAPVSFRGASHSTGTFVLNENMSTNLYWCSVAAQGDSSNRWAQTLFTLEGN
jgi:hypothetical protein